jgi:hypothetical protein
MATTTKKVAAKKTAPAAAEAAAAEATPKAGKAAKAKVPALKELVAAAKDINAKLELEEPMPETGEVLDTVTFDLCGDTGLAWVVQSDASAL